MICEQYSIEFEQLVERRRKFIEGLKANQGEINLEIIEDFYPDKAHFVYELLQNAEDAGATEVSFMLLPDRLECEHNGRAFTLADVTSITGLHDSTKTKEQDKIGKFGVGFKSVFAYTQAPSICSGSWAFRIIHLILPEPLEPVRSLDGRTRFEFPFDNPRKPPREAYSEIAAGLNELDEKALLFLSSLRSVKWRIGTEDVCEVLRSQHSCFHFEVKKERGGRVESSSQFLKFEQSVPSLETQRIAIAFPLDCLPGIRQFDRAAPLAGQLKVVPAEPGSVAVFFPAVKEASGLRFHLHGPFVPELSRASIKESMANKPLFEQLASLAASALHSIKELGLLTPEFLAVLPNQFDQLPLRYQGIREAIVAEMRSKELTPTYTKGHAPASRLLQAGASLKRLLSETDLNFLFANSGEPSFWAVGATQKNNRIDHFLSSLGMREWGLNQFVVALCAGAHAEGGMYPRKPDEQFRSWLKQKPASWMQELYAFLNREAGDSINRLKKLAIVRLADGNLCRADQAYFAGEVAATDVPLVDKAVYNVSGTSSSQQEEAKRFLSSIGVRELGEAEVVEIILKRRYGIKTQIQGDNSYLMDLMHFVTFIEGRTGRVELFKDFYIFQCENGEWHKPDGIFLDHPYMETGLVTYYGKDSFAGGAKALHSSYLICGVDTRRLAEFAKAVGARTCLEVREVDCGHNPCREYLYSGGGNWTCNAINRDYSIPNLDAALSTPSVELSRLIWTTLRGIPAHCLQATFRSNASQKALCADSQLVHVLRDNAWVPQGKGIFVRPVEASRSLLPDGFAFDSGDPWLKVVKFGELVRERSEQAVRKDIAARSLGFVDAAAAERARRFNELPEQEQIKILGDIENRKRPAIPDLTLASPERRAQKIHAQAMIAPLKQSEIRERSISTGRDEVKGQADIYLREHYRNVDGEMTCQICKGPLPFKLDDGSEYFEVVEFLPELRKHHPQNYLALCPNHSAMFQLVNDSRETVRASFRDLATNELAVVLAGQDLTVYFSKTHIIDLKAVLDAEACLSGEVV